LEFPSPQQIQEDGTVRIDQTQSGVEIARTAKVLTADADQDIAHVHAGPIGRTARCYFEYQQSAIRIPTGSHRNQNGLHGEPQTRSFTLYHQKPADRVAGNRETEAAGDHAVDAD